MRVLMLASTFPRFNGDAQPTFILDLASALVCRGIHVTVLLPGDPAALPRETLDGVDVIRFRYAPLRRWETLAYGDGMLGNVRRQPLLWLLLPLYLLVLSWQVRRLCQANNIDVVHAHWLIPQGVCAALALALLPARRRPKLLVTAHGVDVFSFRGKIGRWLKQIVLRRADTVTAVSGKLAAELHDLAPSLQPVIAPMGITLPADMGDVPRAGFCFVGRFVEKKGVLDLIAAYIDAGANGKLPHLTLAGQGPLLAEARRLVTAAGFDAHVTFTGWMTHDEVNRLMGRSALLVMPSRQAANGDQEGLGLVAVEALALGTPMLAYDFPALSEISGPHPAIARVPEGDVAALATALQTAAAESGARLAAAASLAGNIRTRFRWETVARGYADLYAALCTKSIDVQQRKN